MLHSLRDPLIEVLQSRLVLLINHVLAREAAAMQRLRPHAGRTLRIEPQAAPTWLPALPPLALVVTPAGLVDAAQGEATDLRLSVPMDQPLQWLAVATGDARPAVSIEGDAAFAADVSWLAQNLRWDLEADLAEWVGPVVAHGLAQAARKAAEALRGWTPPWPGPGPERPGGRP